MMNCHSGSGYAAFRGIDNGHKSECMSAKSDQGEDQEQRVLACTSGCPRTTTGVAGFHNVDTTAIKSCICPRRPFPSRQRSRIQLQLVLIRTWEGTD